MVVFDPLLKPKVALLSERVPICSTVLEPKPSMPVQNAAYAVPVPPLTVGTIHDPLAEVTEPAEPLTAYPLQFELYQLLLLELNGIILGRVIEPEKSKRWANSC